MPTEVARLGDIGVSLRGTITKLDGTAYDVSDADSITIVLTKPDGSSINRAGSIVNDGVDGVVEYVTVDGDLDQLGTWKADWVITGPASLHLTSTIYKFKVGKVLDEDV